MSQVCCVSVCVSVLIFVHIPVCYVSVAADKAMRLATIEQKRQENVWLVRGGRNLTMSFHRPLFAPNGGGLLDDDVVAAAGNLLRVQFKLSSNCFQAPSLPQKTQASNRARDANYQIHHMFCHTALGIVAQGEEGARQGARGAARARRGGVRVGGGRVEREGVFVAGYSRTWC